MRKKLPLISGILNVLEKLKGNTGIIENTSVATHTIAAGKYVIWKNDLYKASSAISIGDTLSLSNLTAVSDGIANALNSKFTTMEYVTFPFTPQENGIIVAVHGTSDNSAATVYYAEDKDQQTTEYDQYFYVGVAVSTGGGSSSCSFPVRKGHTYTAAYKSNNVVREYIRYYH